MLLACLFCEGLCYNMPISCGLGGLERKDLLVYAEIGAEGWSNVDRVSYSAGVRYGAKKS